jgi:hypothetical protein
VGGQGPGARATMQRVHMSSMRGRSTCPHQLARRCAARPPPLSALLPTHPPTLPRARPRQVTRFERALQQPWQDLPAS